MYNFTWTMDLSDTKILNISNVRTNSMLIPKVLNTPNESQND